MHKVKFMVMISTSFGKSCRELLSLKYENLKIFSKNKSILRILFVGQVLNVNNKIVCAAKTQSLLSFNIVFILRKNSEHWRFLFLQFATLDSLLRPSQIRT